MMPNAKREVMADLIKYLRKKEMEDGADDMGVGEITLSEKEEGHPMEMEKKRFMMENGEDGGEMLDLDEPDLDMEPEHDDSEDLTPAQERIRDFFNNKRPMQDKKPGNSSRTFYAPGKNAEVKAENMPRGRGRPRKG